MRDDAAVFLLRSAKESRHIDQSHKGDVECVAEAYEARGLA